MRKINKIAILGGGLTGLTAAYYLAKKNHQVTVFEKENNLGGLASGFKEKNWNWFLEKTIHHLFSNDVDLLDFAKEIDFNDIFFQSPETASLYNLESKTQSSESNKEKTLNSKFNSKFSTLNYKLKSYPLDTPLDLLRFPLLSFIERIRAGLVLGFIKFFPFFNFYEKYTAQEFLEKTMGKKAYEVLFKELFRKKFGKYAGNILASFFFARIKKRTKKLGYITGGFQSFIDYLENKLLDKNVYILKNKQIDQIKKKNNRFFIDGVEYDAVISTLPTPVLTQVVKEVFPEKFIARLNKIEFLHSISLVVESEKPLFNKTYWTNILVPEIPIMGIFQQTNFINKKNYGGKNLLYCGWYANLEDRLWKMEDREIINYVLPYFKKISNFEFRISNFRVFRAVYAQPIFDKEFLKNKPNFITPVENFFIANLDMTYPYDRGTNYAIKLGKEAANLIT